MLATQCSAGDLQAFSSTSRAAPTASPAAPSARTVWTLSHSDGSIRRSYKWRHTHPAASAASRRRSCGASAHGGEGSVPAHELRAVFDSLDVDGSGAISVDELGDAARLLGLATYLSHVLFEHV